MKPERDATRCTRPDCEREATTATPDGPLCRSHADDLARELRGGGRVE
jgi:hypothetical protein